MGQRYRAVRSPTGKHQGVRSHSKMGSVIAMHTVVQVLVLVSHARINQELVEHTARGVSGFQFCRGAIVAFRAPEGITEGWSTGADLPLPSSKWQAGGWRG
eukprot:gene6642-biopygen13777